MDDMFGDAAQRLFAATFTPSLQRACAPNAALDAAWSACEDAGFTDALMPEAAGGSGLPLNAFFSTALAAGYCALPLPLVHTALIKPALHAAGIRPPTGPIALAAFAHRDGDDVVANAVAWGGTARWVIAQCRDQTWLFEVARAASLLAPSDAPPPRLVGPTADLRWPIAAGTPIDVREVAIIAAAAHAGVAAGAMQRLLEMTVGYAEDRKQFGKNIGKFQAIQQQISVMAELTAAARIGAQMAFHSTTAQPERLLAAVAKRTTSAATPTIVATAHAVHGAIGVTAEYDLHVYARLLQHCRHAAGGEMYWDRYIGREALAASESGLDFVRTRLNASRDLSAV